MNPGEWILALFGGSIAKIVFLSIFFAGMTVTMFKLIFGGDADHGDVGHGDFHADGDTGDAVDHGDMGDHDDAQGGGAPGVLSFTGLTFLLTGYGGTAFIVMHFTDKVVLSSFAGLAGGWPFALFCLWLYKLFLSQQASSMIKNTDFLGATGMIDTPIREGRLGEVILTIRGRQVTQFAMTKNRSSLPSGTPVRVTEYLGDRVIVEKIS